MAIDILDNLLEEIQSKTELVTDFLTKVKLHDAINQIRDMYLTNALGFIQTMKQLLEVERQLVHRAENPNAPQPTTPGMGDAHQQFLNQFEVIQRRTQETDVELKHLVETQETFNILFHEKCRIDEALNRSQQQQDQATITRMQAKKKEVDETLNVKATEVLNMRTNMANKLFQSVNELAEIQNCVLNDHLMGWRRQQQLSGNGVPFFNNLDQIQQLCELLAEYIWQCKQQLSAISQLRAKLPIPMESNQDLHPVLTQKIQDLLSALVTSTFIVDRQPPQVGEKVTA